MSERNPYVAAPLRRTDCSLISDGAAALVLADADLLPDLRRAIAFRARQHVNDILPLSRRDPIAFRGRSARLRAALDQAGLVLDDLSLVETHDCFTIAELIEYEAMGLTPRRQGHKALREGWVQKDGRLPVNPSGGLKAKGHPVGATGVSMHVMACMQLAGEAAGMQIPARRWRACSTWAARPWPTTSASWSAPNERTCCTYAGRRRRAGIAPVMNLAHFLVQAARRHPERHALICGEATLSWRELDGRSAALARRWPRMAWARGPRAGAFAQQL